MFKSSLALRRSFLELSFLHQWIILNFQSMIPIKLTAMVLQNGQSVSYIEWVEMVYMLVKELIIWIVGSAAG